MKIAGAILAGGKATRYANRPKGLLRLPGGETIIEHLLGEMGAAGLEPRVISANEERLYTHFGVPVIPDFTKGKGPLGGIEAVLLDLVGRVEAVLFLPCDTPNITAAEVRGLCEQFRSGESRIVYAQTERGVAHPLCCVVNVRVLDDVTKAVREGLLAVWRLWKELGATSTRFDVAERFANVNVLGEFADVVRVTQERIGAGDDGEYNESSWLPEGGDPVQMSIEIPEAMRSEFIAFLTKEHIDLAVATDGKGSVKIVSGESRQECSTSMLYSGGWIKCEVGRATADKLHIKYKDIGKILDFLDIKIRDCAMGCF